MDFRDLILIRFLIIPADTQDSTSVIMNRHNKPFVRKEHVVIVGDSNLREVKETRELSTFKVIVAGGCKMFEPSNKWNDKLMSPLRDRLLDPKLPEVKFLVVHLGTNDEGKSLLDFRASIRLFIDEMRSLLDRVAIVFSEVLPRCPHYKKYNDNE